MKQLLSKEEHTYILIGTSLDYECGFVQMYSGKNAMAEMEEKGITRSDIENSNTITRIGGGAQLIDRLEDMKIGDIRALDTLEYNYIIRIS